MTEHQDAVRVASGIGDPNAIVVLPRSRLDPGRQAAACAESVTLPRSTGTGKPGLAHTGAGDGRFR